MESPLVSVIIPAFNEEKYLHYCLSSITKQTYKNVEVIVVDDGSTDRSLSIAKKYNAQILTQRHQGPAAARNFGAKKSHGSILVFADADMRFSSTYVEKLIEPILKKKAIGTFVKEEMVANPDNIWSRCWSINANLPADRRLPKDYPETENGFRAIRRDYFEKVGGFTVGQGYTDDETLSRKLQIKAINANGAVSYHYNPSSLSEVFYSARWIGRSSLFFPTIANFLRYSPINSLRVGVKYLFNGAPISFILFKLFFDAGMFSGIFFRGETTAK